MRIQGTKNASGSWNSCGSLDGKNDNSSFCFTFCDLLTIHTLLMALGSLRILSNNGTRPLLALLYPLLWDLACQRMTCPEIKFCNKINILSYLHLPVWVPCHTTYTITSDKMFYINKLYEFILGSSIHCFVILDFGMVWKHSGHSVSYHNLLSCSIYVSIKYLFLLFLFVCVCMAYVSGCPLKSIVGVGSQRAGVTDSCELSDMGAGNQTLIFWKNNNQF